MVRDITSYGSNLVVRAYHSSKKETADVVICLVFLKQVVAMLDAIDELLRAGAVHAGFLAVRAAFEASLYVQWLMIEEADHKARCYLVGNYRAEREWAKLGISGSAERTAFEEKFEIQIDDALSESGEARLTEIDRVLAIDTLAPVNREFTTKRKKRNQDPEWYQVAGAESIRSIAETLHRSQEYTLIYSKGSNVTHSARYSDHVGFGQQRAQMKSVRHLGELKVLIESAVVVAMRTFEAVMRYYRPAELAALGRHYAEYWSEPFRNIKTIHYTSS